MPFFQSVKRTPSAEKGSGKVFITTRAGIKIWLDPFSEERSGPVCLDVPAGRRCMRKIMGRYEALKKLKRFVDVTQVRGMVKYVAAVREQHGEQIARAVRLLSSQLMNGYEIVGLNKHQSAYEKLAALGVQLVMNGRQVTISDMKGSFSYQDDYYFTATKWCLLELLRKYNIGLTLVDQRERNSVERIIGDRSDLAMVKFFDSGEYVKNRLTKYWGGLSLENCRKVVFREDVQQVGTGFRILQTKSKGKLLWKEARTRGEWVAVFQQVLSHNFRKSETEHLKTWMSASQFKRVRGRVRVMEGENRGFLTLPKLCEVIYDALETELGYDPKLWVCFVVRGCNNLLRYRGDRLDQLAKAYDELSSISTDQEGGSVSEASGVG